MALSGAQIVVLANELTTDPLVRGYSGMTDQQASDNLNTVDRNLWVDIVSAQLYECTDDAEEPVPGSDLANKLKVILGLGSGITTAPGSKIRRDLIAIFGTDSNTAVSLLAVANPMQSRAAELGLGTVKSGDVAAARTL